MTWTTSSLRRAPAGFELVADPADISWGERVAWIADPDGMDNVKSEVMLALWEAFKREGIRVPYPVREIRVRGGALPVRPSARADDRSEERREGQACSWTCRSRWSP